MISDENENNLQDDNADPVESFGIKAMHYNNIVDRYFTKYYIDENTDKEQYIFIHTNGVVMCGLGKNNYIIKNKSNLKIKEIKDLNKMTKLSGKRKNGAHVLMENEYILQFNLEGEFSNGSLLENKNEEKDNNSTFAFSPKVKGKLIELNSNIFINPEIVQNSPEKHGFLCFILPVDLKAVDVLRDRLEKYKNK